MDSSATLPTAPATPVDAAGRLLRGRWVGHLPVDPVSVGPRRGRVRRWYYVGAGDEHAAVGAAVVDLGVVAVGFAWACFDDRTHTWETRLPLGRGARVATTPAGASLRTRSATLVLGGDGALDLDVPTGGTRLRARVEPAGGVDPVVLSTPTDAGGWNVTQKAAGHAVTGWLRADGAEHALGDDAGGWRDWTSGRQDRHTTWRWAAGAGTDGQGRRVGLNVSTGMNGAGPGEDLVWWEGAPRPVALERLAPIGRDARGSWRVSGADWAMRFTPRGVRAADENLLVLRSHYVQPIGRFAGTLPGPDGEPVEVTLTGVTEDHLAVW
jgi:hypothetical protein